MKSSGKWLLVAGAIGLASCSNNDDNGSATKSAVLKNYADIVSANYQKAYDDAVAMENAINTFTATPTQANFDAAKNSWKQARESYGTTEAFRFSDGPIDAEGGVEPYLNAWPLDENFIDYVDGDPGAGIINHTAEYPTLSKGLLIGLNEDGGEKNISIGYHAIEFLLWGQDLTAPSENLPGQRPYTDYLTTGGTASNQARRATYLNICADLLTDHLQILVEAWQPGGSYRGTFLSMDQDLALKNVFTGIATLAAAELAVERMDVALFNQDQEDEHSCFSDNTHRDIALNLQGIINVYRGDYGTIHGPGLDELVRAANSTTANETDGAIDIAVSDVAAIAIPFDYAISGGPNSPEGQKVKAAVEQLQTLGAEFIAGASALGIQVNAG